jgi:hypothetical protein
VNVVNAFRISVSDGRRPSPVTVPLAQAPEEVLWRYAGDVGLLVRVCSARNGIVAIAAALDAVEDDADEDDEEESAKSGAQCDQHNDASRVVVACVVVSLRKRHHNGTDGDLPPDLRGLVREENRLVMVPL